MKPSHLFFSAQFQSSMFGYSKSEFYVRKAATSLVGFIRYYVRKITIFCYHTLWRGWLNPRSPCSKQIISYCITQQINKWLPWQYLWQINIAMDIPHLAGWYSKPPFIRDFTLQSLITSYSVYPIISPLISVLSPYFVPVNNHFWMETFLVQLITAKWLFVDQQTNKW